MSEDQAAQIPDSGTANIGGNSDTSISPGFATKLDGSIIDLTAGEDEDNRNEDSLTAVSTDGTALSDGTFQNDDKMASSSEMVSKYDTLLSYSRTVVTDDGTISNDGTAVTSDGTTDNVGKAVTDDGTVINDIDGAAVTGDRTIANDGTAITDDGTAINKETPNDGTTNDTTALNNETSLRERMSQESIDDEPDITGLGMQIEDTDIESELIEEQLLDDPLTPATDNSSMIKSLPGSGRVTPASQSDHSLTLSSSEKSTPHRKLKVSDMTGRQIDYDSMSSSSGSVKNLQFPQRLGINWRKGERLEAMDYLNSWFPAKIRAINEDELQVLIHFDGWNQRYDEWIDMSSDRIRPLVRHSERKEKVKRARTNPHAKRQLKEHKIGDAVYAKWTDCKMYPAKITNIMPTGSYEVIFYDGFKKLVQPINIRSMPNEYKQKTFEISPVPESILKKAKMKLDHTETTVSPDDKQEQKSGEKVKIEQKRDSSVEKDKKVTKTKKRKLIIPGLFSDTAVVGLGDVDPSMNPEIKVEPVSSQAEYKVDTVEEIKSEPGTSSTSGAGVSINQAQVPLCGPLPPKAFIVESDHNQFKCHYDGCNKGFRKEHLLDYHIKYYHINSGGPPPPPAKRRRKTTSTCSTESDSVPGSKKSAGKKIRNFSAESSTYPGDIKLEYPDIPLETGEISTQTSPSKNIDGYPPDEYGFKQDSMEESSVTDAEDFLKPDELVNCICDFQEENGLMIQCEVCMCWQHAACFGITERTLPTKTYVCFVCENPPGVRESSRFIHEQDWFKTGEIASFSFLPLPAMSEERCSTVKSTHTLVAEIHQLNSVLHSLRMQLKILRTKDECKLKQWRIDWDVVENDTVESYSHTQEHSSVKEEKNYLVESSNQIKEELGAGVLEANVVNGKDKLESADTKSDCKPNTTKDVNGKTEIKTDIGVIETNDNKIGEVKYNVQDSTKEALGIKTETTAVKLENGTDFKTGCEVYVGEAEEGIHSDSTESVVEDPIEVCEKNLLSHIVRLQNEISDRFDKIEEQVEMLEAMEAMQSRREPPTKDNVFNDMPQLKRSLRNMNNDLCKVKKMSVFH